MRVWADVDLALAVENWSVLEQGKPSWLINPPRRSAVSLCVRVGKTVRGSQWTRRVKANLGDVGFGAVPSASGVESKSTIGSPIAEEGGSDYLVSRQAAG